MSSKPKKTKICFIGPKAYPLFNPNAKGVFGGAEVDLYFLATELAKDRNFDVSFITADYGQKQTETTEDVSIIKSLNFKQNPLIGALKIWCAMKQADAQIYMLKSISPGLFLAGLFCRLHNKAFIFRTSTVTDSDGSYLKKHIILGKIFKCLLKNTKAVLVQNKADKENLRHTTGIDSIAIPNGHRLAKLKKTKRDAVLWVGRSSRIKRPELFIDLAEKIPDQKFTMICQRATKDNKYDQLVSRAKAVKNLEFIERVPFDKVQKYFQKAKVFVNTSETEGFPNTFIQACIYGTPILSLNVNPDGFLDEFDCGICCTDDFNKFANSLETILKQDRREQMGTNARKYVEKNHNIEKTVQEYKKLFQEPP